MFGYIRNCPAVRYVDTHVVHAAVDDGRLRLLSRPTRVDGMMRGDASFNFGVAVGK